MSRGSQKAALRRRSRATHILSFTPQSVFILASPAAPRAICRLLSQPCGGGGFAADRSGAKQRTVSAIVFHGDRDTTVNLRNAEVVVAQAGRSAILSKHAEPGRTSGGYPYTRMLSMDAGGRTMMEGWVVHGAGHAWFGDDLAGSYTDLSGPDAAREMMRFSLEHQKVHGRRKAKRLRGTNASRNSLAHDVDRRGDSTPIRTVYR
jgi:poly(3-hydroxybutyrate) depolymerase